MTFPITGQLANEFFIDPRDLFPGTRYGYDFNVDVVPTAIVGATAAVGQQDTVTVTYNADGEAFGFLYDGITIQADADTNDDDSATALGVAVQAAIDGAMAGIIASVSVGTNVVTVVSVAGSGAHTLADFEPEATTVVIANAVAAAGTAEVSFGMGVTQDAAFPDLIGAGHSAVREPRTVADALWGVMVQQQVNNFDNATLTLLGLPNGFLAPAPVHWQVVKRGRIIVPWVGTLPATKGAGSPVFWINGVAAAASIRGAFRDDNTNAVAVPNTEVERVITRPMGAFSGFVGINFGVAL